MNLVIPLELYDELGRRYQAEWPWADTRPRIHQVPRHEADGLRAGLRTLLDPDACCSRLMVEALVLQALALAKRLQQERHWPAWLRRCLQRLEEPEGLRAGVAGLAREAGCSREHLARTVKRHLGCSMRDLITRRRLEAAARCLRSGNEHPERIAAMCGYPTSSNFYQLFQRQYGCSPKQYRLRHDTRFV